jgi:hypothetical protein
MKKTHHGFNLRMTMGVADTYFAPTKKEDEALLRELDIEQKEVILIPN